MHRVEKGCAPRLDHHEQPAGTKNTAHLIECPREVLWNSRQVMQAALDDRDIGDPGRDWQSCAVAHGRRPPVTVFAEKPLRHIHAVNLLEAHSSQRLPTTPSSAEEV